MILGNTNGKNRGKKYIMRGKHELVVCKNGEHRAKQFNEWFVANFDSLMGEIITKDMYNGDIINDTYLRMYENLLYGGADIDNYRSYFIRSCFTNIIQGNVKANKYCALPDTLDTVADTSYNHEVERKQQLLEEDIFNYVYNKYKVREFELFKMYVSLKPAVNYEILAEITQLKTHQVQATVSKIKKDICKNREFARRRKEVMV